MWMCSLWKTFIVGPPHADKILPTIHAFHSDR